MKKLYKTKEALEVFKGCYLPSGSVVKLEHTCSENKYHWFKLLGVFEGFTMFIDMEKVEPYEIN